MTDRPVRTRIAPSPTGDPHVGTAYMGLVNMVFARQHGGQFLLRIDDTDQGRYREGSEAAIFEALRWLGLEWDEGPDRGGPCGPYRQSERTELYREHARALIERGAAYRCFCSEERLKQVRTEQEKRKERTRYDGHCRTLEQAEVERRAAAGEPFVVRLAVDPAGTTVVRDLLRGEIPFQHEDGLQDQVLLKSDGFPTYHLATVVDDHHMGISHIIRAEEWISSTPIHVLLFRASGWEPPVFCHMPLLRNEDKSKISKRKNPTSLLYYRDRGFLPEGLLNFLGLMGWGGPRQADGTSQEIFTVAEMQAAFRLEDIRLGGPVFDLAKLRHVNAEHLRRLAPAEFHRRVSEHLLGPERVAQVASFVQSRCETLGDFMSVADFFFAQVAPTGERLLPKTLEKQVAQAPDKERAQARQRAEEEVWFTLNDVVAALERVAPWTAERIEAAARELATPEQTGWSSRDLFMTLRVAITGKTETPPLFESMELLGRSVALGRLGDALRGLAEPSKKAVERRKKERARAEAARVQPAAGDLSG